MSKEEQLEKLEKLTQETLCDELSKSAKNLVFGKGNCNASVLFIGEAPGMQEDVEGIPFVGRAGLELDKILNEIGLGLDECYIANILKYRPPNNRDPTIEEIREHAPYLIKQVEIIEPKIIVTLGNFSTKFVLSKFNTSSMNKVLGVTQLHGKIQYVEKNGKKYKVMPMFHPAAILYKPVLREQFVKDFENLKKHLTQNESRNDLNYFLKENG